MVGKHVFVYNGVTELCKSVSQLMVEWPQLTQSRPFTQMQPGSRSANTTNHDIKATMDLRKSTKAALQRCTLSRHETTFTFSLYLELQRLQTWFGLIASAKRTSHDVAEI